MTTKTNGLSWLSVSLMVWTVVPLVILVIHRAVSQPSNIPNPIFDLGMIATLPDTCAMTSSACFAGYMSIMAAGVVAIRLLWSDRHNRAMMIKRLRDREQLINDKVPLIGDDEQSISCEDSAELFQVGQGKVRLENEKKESSSGSQHTGLDGNISPFDTSSSSSKRIEHNKESGTEEAVKVKFERKENDEGIMIDDTPQRICRRKVYYDRAVSMVFKTFTVIEGCSIWIAGICPNQNDEAGNSGTQVAFLSIAFLSEIICDTITGVVDYKTNLVNHSTSIARFVIIFLELCVSIAGSGCGLGSSKDGLYILSFIGVLVSASYWGTYYSPFTTKKSGKFELNI